MEPEPTFEIGGGAVFVLRVDLHTSDASISKITGSSPPVTAGMRSHTSGLSSFLCEVVVHVVGSRRPGKVMANALSACFHPWVPVPSSPLLLFPMLRIAK